MTKRIVTAALIGIFCSAAVWAELRGTAAVGSDGMYTYYEYDDENYILKLDPSDGKVITYWDADDFRNYKIYGTVDDDLLLMIAGYRGNSLCRFRLPDEVGAEPAKLWEISLGDGGNLLTGRRVYVAQNDETVDVYSIDNGKKVEEFEFNAERFSGFSDGCFYAIRDNHDEFVKFSLDGEEQWAVDVERISFDRVYTISGYVFLADMQNRELFCIDKEGNKLWRHVYPRGYLPLASASGYGGKRRQTVVQAGNYAVFADNNNTVFVSLENGDVAASTAPGISEIPHGIYGSTFVKVTAVDNYNRYGGPGDAVELFNLDELRLDALLTTPAPIVDNPRPVPKVSDEGVMYLPLEDDRLIGIDLTSGETVLDVTIELFPETDDGAW